MTYEKAKATITIIRRETMDSENNFNGKELRNRYEALVAATEALEKQIPKKIIIEDGYDYCPSCGYRYGTDAVRRMLYRWNHKHCISCGQKIDWSVEA